MSEELCDLTELPKNGCSHCTGRDGGESEAKARDKRLLTNHFVRAAEFPGQCVGCGGGIGIGDPIRRAYHADGWVSSCCMTDQGKPRA